MLKTIIDIGYKYGRLTVTKIYKQYKEDGTYLTMVECQCECGKTTIVRLTSLKANKLQSCGCYYINKNGKEDIKHGRSKTRLYRIYNQIITRCYNKNSTAYSIYGGIGITVCKEWLEDYKVFEKWSLDNDYAKNLSLDRINPHLSYSPDNCRWATAKEQANNKRKTVYITCFNEKKTAKQWEDDERCKVTASTLQYRLRQKWPIEMAITTPPLKNKHSGGPNKADFSLADYSHTRKKRNLHGLYYVNPRLRHIWNAMKRRCYNTNYARYNECGGRGIIVCDEWKNSFPNFYHWAIQNGYADNLSIDRIDVNGNYTPENCRWTTVFIQNNNKRNNKKITAFGETKTITEWICDPRCVVSSKILYNRIHKFQYEAERAITTPKYGS